MGAQTIQVDEENPEVASAIPTDADVLAWLPPSEEAIAEAAAVAAAAAAAALVVPKGKAKDAKTKGKDEPAPAPVATGVSKPTLQPGDAGYLLPRQRHLNDVDEALEAQQNKNWQGFDDRVSKLNASTSHPCYFHIPLGVDDAENDRVKEMASGLRP